MIQPELFIYHLLVLGLDDQVCILDRSRWKGSNDSSRGRAKARLGQTPDVRVRSVGWAVFGGEEQGSVMWCHSSPFWESWSVPGGRGCKQTEVAMCEGGFERVLFTMSLNT